MIKNIKVLYKYKIFGFHTPTYIDGKIEYVQPWNVSVQSLW